MTYNILVVCGEIRVEELKINCVIFGLVSAELKKSGNDFIV